MTDIHSTKQTIQMLSGGHKSYSPYRMRYGVFTSLIILSFVTVIFFVFIQSYSSWPYKDKSTRFFMESLTWLAMALAGLMAFIRSSFPAQAEKKDSWYVLVLISVLGAFLLTRFSFDTAYTELSQEMNWFRGRCGPAIFVTALFASAAMATLARKLAPTHPRRTAVWIAFTSGAFASFLMQFVCAYENTWHILIWHVMPIFILCWISALLGQKILRW